MPEPKKGTKTNANPIDESRVADVGELVQIYSDDDKTYLSYLQERLQTPFQGVRNLGRHKRWENRCSIVRV